MIGRWLEPVLFTHPFESSVVLIESGNESWLLCFDLLEYILDDLRHTVDTLVHVLLPQLYLVVEIVGDLIGRVRVLPEHRRPTAAECMVGGGASMARWSLAPAGNRRL